jgi:ribosomal protein S18 acetylase RimI-like enzyme
MLENGESLSREDLARVAALHVASIDDSIPTMLGERYARAFFAYLAHAPYEYLFIERVDGRIESVCVVSLAPATVYMRTLRATLPQLVVSAGLAVFRSAKFRRFVVRFVRDLAAGAGEAQHLPDITYIFTHPELRSRGHGGRLVKRVEKFLRARGTPLYTVRTIDEDWNRALHFYEAQGFHRTGRQVEGGRPFALFEKAVPLSLSSAA